jgi:hypothetical protein
MPTHQTLRPHYLNTILAPSILPGVTSLATSSGFSPPFPRSLLSKISLISARIDTTACAREQVHFMHEPTPGKGNVMSARNISISCTRNRYGARNRKQRQSRTIEHQYGITQARNQGIAEEGRI